VAREIWLGPVLGNNRERLLARCAEYLANGQTDRLLYIAASHPLLELVTDKVLEGKIARGVWGEFPFYLFRGFVRRVLSSAVGAEARASATTNPGTKTCLAAGLAPRVPIDREELPLRPSLISQIIKQLSAARKLPAIQPLANRDGCLNTIASLIGEIQRAGKMPKEFRIAIEARAPEFATEIQSHKDRGKGRRKRTARSQIDFDREVALIYESYSEVLDRFGLTDEDADQLRALQVLRGELDGREISLPWLNEIELLVLDGFFDFTPVQGEMLRRLIPAVPNVIVNLNYDQKNEEIFRPFAPTIDQLKSFAPFEIKRDSQRAGKNVAQAVNLRPSDTSQEEPSQINNLRHRLFNVAEVVNLRRSETSKEERSQINNLRHKLFECSDRETEIRSIAREIKRLVHQQGYGLSDIGLVVRERTSYADAILRVCAEESIPCNLERRTQATEVPSVRACAKLFELLRDPVREHLRNPKASDVAHLVKSGYFRVRTEDLSELWKTFNATYHGLLTSNGQRAEGDRLERLRLQLGIGRWAPDILENVFAYVGSELRVDSWLARAQKLISALPSPEAARSFVSGNEANEGDDGAALVEREIPEDLPEKAIPKTPAPVHPAAIAWTILIMQHLRGLIAEVPADGLPENLRTAVMSLLEQLDFSQQVTQPFFKHSETDLPQITLNVRGLESVRRAMAAAVRSFNYTRGIVATPCASATTDDQKRHRQNIGLQSDIALSGFIDEVQRSLRSQMLSIGGGNRDGLRVLEATDVRGLRFHVLFIAGMTEGGFPLRASGDWLYPHEERERLRKYGVALEDISNDTLLKEEYYFYQAACRATHRLYLTRPLTHDDGTETVASYYIEELRRAIAPATLAKEIIRSDVDQKDLRDSSTASEFITVLIRHNPARGHNNFRKPYSKDCFQQLIAESEARGYISSSALRRIAVEQERNGAWFGPFDGAISNADLRGMLARHFGAESVYSASSLSTYGKCPFRFFAARVLKLEPRNEAALDLPAIDAGKLLHEILRRFFTDHRGQYLPSCDAQKLRQEMACVAEEVFREHEQLVPALNERIWRIDCEIRKLILDQVLLYELKLQQKSNARSMRPTFFELAFGRSSRGADPKSRTDYLQIQRSHAAETALIQGQIDRVDINAEEQVAIAYDYKLSQGARLSDIEAAREIQIPIYLAALEQLFVPGYELAGGGYYRLRPRSARLNQGLYRHSFADCTSVTGKNLHDDVTWRRIRETVRHRVWEFIDGMRAGDFRVSPSRGKPTCKFCDYSAVCRYDTYRISRKREKPSAFGGSSV
jgi:ATP-dependent helicase/DNAse subunit B